MSADGGERKIAFASEWMPVLNAVRDRLRDAGTLAGRRIAVILPVEPKTAYLAACLADAGAEVTVAFQGTMVHDDVAAGLAARGVAVFARSGSGPEEEAGFFEAVLARRPEVAIDDRAALVRLAHARGVPLLGASEETTSGVRTLRAMAAGGALRFPCLDANGARCKHLFDNRYGTGQSALNAILDATNLLLADKDVLVLGYGFVGRGIAARARGLGARVLVSEIDPFAALEAHHDGFEVEPAAAAVRRADVIVTATGMQHALPLSLLATAKEGAIVANAGAVDDEIELRDGPRRRVRAHVEELQTGGRTVFLVGGGVVVNLAAGEGHPAEIMDLTFALQALAAEYLLEHGSELAPGLHPLPAELDEAVARLALDALGIGLDTLDEQQERFLRSWEPLA